MRLEVTDGFASIQMFVLLIALRSFVARLRTLIDEPPLDDPVPRELAAAQRRPAEVGRPAHRRDFPLVGIRLVDQVREDQALVGSVVTDVGEERPVERRVRIRPVELADGRVVAPVDHLDALVVLVGEVVAVERRRIRRG